MPRSFAPSNDGGVALLFVIDSYNKKKYPILEFIRDPNGDYDNDGIPNDIGPDPENPNVWPNLLPKEE